MDTLQQIGTNNTQAFKIVEVSFKGRPVNEICKLEMAGLIPPLSTTGRFDFPLNNQKIVG
jgi:hypothetical protein